MSSAYSPCTMMSSKAVILTVVLTVVKTKNCWFPKQALVFTGLQDKCFENTEGEGEIACNEQFLLFRQCFLPIWITSCYFHQIHYCRLQILSVWKSLKVDVWERVKGCNNLSHFMHRYSCVPVILYYSK